MIAQPFGLFASSDNGQYGVLPELNPIVFFNGEKSPRRLPPQLALGMSPR